MTDSIQSAVVAVTSMADEFPESLPSFDDEASILDALPEVDGAFHVTDEDSANWVCRHIVEARARSERAKAWAKKEQERAAKEEDFFLKRFGAELEMWTRRQLTGKKKSVALPSGTLGFRKKSERLVVDDDRAIVAWAKQAHPELVVTVVKESVPAVDLNALLKRTGEVPPDEAAHIEPEADSFYVK